MPTVLRWRGHKFLFFSLDEGEPPHIHVLKGDGQAKSWLSDCELSKSKGLTKRELRQIQAKVEEHREELVRAWHEHFGTRG